MGGDVHDQWRQRMIARALRREPDSVARALLEGIGTALAGGRFLIHAQYRADAEELAGMLIDALDEVYALNTYPEAVVEKITVSYSEDRDERG